MTLQEVLKSALESVSALSGHIYPLDGVKNAKPPMEAILNAVTAA